MRGRTGVGQSTQGLTLNNRMSEGRMAATRLKLRDREVTERKQVGDAESLINEEPGGLRSETEWLE